MTSPEADLSVDERTQLRDGFHEDLAKSLRARGRADLAGWVFEQIWAWPEALCAYQEAGRTLDALRCAVESGQSATVHEVLDALVQGNDPDELSAAIDWLEANRRPMDAARLLAHRDDDPKRRALALLRGGDALSGARALAEAGAYKQALDVVSELNTAASLRFAAELSWELGDAEACARMAQRAMRREEHDATRDLLARALAALGHDIAAQIVLRGEAARPVDAISPGRYRVRARLGAGMVGSTYLALDRATLEEVELHLLLAGNDAQLEVTPKLRQQLKRFARIAQAAADLGHSAIRPIHRLDADAGLLVMPRATDLTVKGMLRPPGLRRARSRARAMVAFMLDGLIAAHDHGWVHGWLLPSLITFDAAGRPLLPPFGAYHLSGLAATHTGGLDELMAMTAPELRDGSPPTPSSDLYALGVLLQGLLDGTLRSPEAFVGPARAPEDELARAMCAPTPTARPRAGEVLDALRTPVSDVREVAAPQVVVPAASSSGIRLTPTEGVQVHAHESWGMELLDTLCAGGSPWLQPILERDGRVFTLAAWPEGCAALDPDVPSFIELLEPDALTFSAPQLEAAIITRLRATSLVRTPAGIWMLALDDLLPR